MPALAVGVSRRRLLSALSLTGAWMHAARRANAGVQPASSAASPAAGDTRMVAGLAWQWCPPGTFLMGSPAFEPHHRADEEQVTVRVRRGFWMGRYEVTQGQWRALMGPWPGRAPSAEFGLGDDVPMYWVNYAQANAFCDAVTAAARRAGDISDGWTCLLPTEAQWEYACRAGTTTASAFGPVLTSAMANMVDPAANAAGRPALGRACEVGRYRPNAWGLHDMHGNVFEWCRDWYHARLPGGDDPDLTATRGVPNRDGTYSRVRRGGAWNDEARFCRSALRLRYEPERDSDHIGFRVALVSTAEQGGVGAPPRRV